MPTLCVFDLDHTLVRSPLDLAAIRAEVRALVADRGVALPAHSVGWTIAETIAASAAIEPDLERAAWALVLDHETRALEQVTGEPGARDALEALAAAGVALAVWTNNARAAARHALARCGLAPFFATIVSRDEAALKPDPAGLRLLRAAFPDRAVWVIGDSWIDGAAAVAGGARFIGYRTEPGELARRAVTPAVILHDLRALPGWLAAQEDGDSAPPPRPRGGPAGGGVAGRAGKD